MPSQNGDTQKGMGDDLDEPEEKTHVVASRAVEEQYEDPDCKANDVE